MLCLINEEEIASYFNLFYIYLIINQYQYLLCYKFILMLYFIFKLEILTHNLDCSFELDNAFNDHII
jgi:hypothetical protein